MLPRLYITLELFEGKPNLPITYSFYNGASLDA